MPKKPYRKLPKFNDPQLAVLVEAMIEAYAQFEWRREMVNGYINHMMAERDKLLGQAHDLEAQHRAIEDKLSRLSALDS